MSRPTVPSGDSFPRSLEEMENAYTLRSYGVGIDCHSRFIQVCVLVKDETGVRRSDAEFATTWTALTQAREHIRALLQAHLCPEDVDQLEREGIRYTLESTGTYHLPVIKALSGIPSVVNPLLANPSRRKTDVLDARLLAYHAIAGMWPPSHLPTEPIQTLRVLLNMREDAQRTALRCANRINNFLLRYGHTFGALTPVAGTTGRAITEDLLEDRSPVVDGAGPATLPVMEGVCPTGLPEAVKPVFRSLYEMYDEAIRQKKRYEKEAQVWADRCEFLLGTGELVKGAALRALLLSVPGFGSLSVLYWMAEVVTPTRFRNAKALSAYCGCDPSLKVSAGKVTQHVRRSGNQKLHRTLTRAAQSLITHGENPLGNWGRSIWKRQKVGGFKRACAAVSRRMVEASYHVTRTGTPFSFDGYAYHHGAEYDERPIAPAEYGRFHKVLGGYGTASALARVYDEGALTATKGVGEKCLDQVKQVLQNHRLSPARRKKPVRGERVCS